jgi:hypothetical protein
MQNCGWPLAAMDWAKAAVRPMINKLSLNIIQDIMQGKL